MAIIAKYGLNGNANDSAGSNNGTASNITYVDGKSGQAGSFNGSSSKITHPTLLDSGLSAWSISFWVKTSMSGTRGFIIDKEGSGSPGYPIEISISSTNKLQIYNSGFSAGVNIFSGTTSINTGNWIHCVCSGDSSGRNSLKICINGIPEGSLITGTGADTGSIAASTAFDFTIGKRNYSGEGFNGLIDEVEIHNTALTAAEIKNKYLFYNGFM